VQGFTLTCAACVGVSPSLLILRSVSASTSAWVLQVPKPDDAGSTQSPFSRPVELEPVETTSKTPSLPGTAAGGWVPSSEVKVGLAP